MIWSIWCEEKQGTNRVLISLKNLACLPSLSSKSCASATDSTKLSAIAYLQCQKSTEGPNTLLHQRKYCYALQTERKGSETNEFCTWQPSSSVLQPYKPPGRHASRSILARLSLPFMTQKFMFQNTFWSYHVIFRLFERIQIELKEKFRIRCSCLAQNEESNWMRRGAFSQSSASISTAELTEKLKFFYMLVFQIRWNTSALSQWNCKKILL